MGIQDQIQVCHGGFNVTKISRDSTYSLISMDKTNNIINEINDSLILVYSGITDSPRRSKVIAKITKYKYGEAQQKLLMNMQKIC